jgi:predicted branched-subunit amino acid permease
MHTTTSTIKNRGLWVAQALLAALFLFAGAMKFVMPDEALAAQSPFSVAFIHFIGVCEILGALGLVLPWATGVARWLTPLAAEGLVVIMVGAVVTTLAIGGGAGAVVPAAVGALCVAVAAGRGRAARRPAAWRLAAAR